jgi:hypothetical protein
VETSGITLPVSFQISSSSIRNVIERSTGWWWNLESGALCDRLALGYALRSLPA